VTSPFDDSVESLRAEHEALMQFLYLAPVGLVQAGIDGEIVMINPISAQLLMPLSPDGCLTNLFSALEGVAPALRLQCAQYPKPNGMVFEGEHIHLRAEDRRGTPQILSLTLLKLDAERIMAVIQDVTAEVRRERQLRQSDAWLNAILTRISDYALAALDRQGRLCDWNDSIARVTGFGEHIVGSPYSIFYPPDAMTGEHLLDRLREADLNGWSMDEGLRLRADGSQFWCSALIAPLPDREAFGDDPLAPAYCLILRDISDKRAATEKRRQAAFCDHLTSLSNRRAFFEAAELELDRAAHSPRALALIVFDADRFKHVTTSTATRRATACCATWPTSCATPSARSTRWRAWVEKNSRCCCPRPASNRRWPAPSACAWPSRPAWWRPTASKSPTLSAPASPFSTAPAKRAASTC
jgi:PAS domain S-box-containing protein